MTNSQLLQHFKMQDRCTDQHLGYLLRKNGIQARVAKPKFKISAVNKKARVQFAKHHLQRKTNWKNVIFSDEVTIQCSTKGRILVKRRRHEAYSPNKLVNEELNRQLKVNSN